MLVIGSSVVDTTLVTGNSMADIMLVIGNNVVDIMLVLSRIFTCLRALIFGEDFSSDPVSRVFGLIVHKSSRGQVQVDTAILSQVRPLAPCDQDAGHCTAVRPAVLQIFSKYMGFTYMT